MNRRTAKKNDVIFTGRTGMEIDLLVSMINDLRHNYGNKSQLACMGTVWPSQESGGVWGKRTFFEKAISERYMYIAKYDLL